MRDLADLLEEHVSTPFPAEIEKGRDYGMVDPVMIDAEMFGWASSYTPGFQLNTDAHRSLERVRLELGESWGALPAAARPYFARLLRIADAAIQGCETVAAPAPPVENGIDLVARVACNGEVMWARSHAHQVLRALTDAGLEILGLDLRKYTPDGGTHEAPWSSIQPDDGATNLDRALRSFEAAVDSDLTDYPWVLITYRSANRPGPALTTGEVELLTDGLTDDISFDNALIDLGLRGNPPARNEPPDAIQIDAAFRSYERLLNAGLIRLGRVQYIDGGPPGRVAPIEHLVESLTQVRARVEEACRTASDWGDWGFSCWSVNTSDGDAAARERLGNA